MTNKKIFSILLLILSPCFELKASLANIGNQTQVDISVSPSPSPSPLPEIVELKSLKLYQKMDLTKDQRTGQEELNNYPVYPYFVTTSSDWLASRRPIDRELYKKVARSRGETGDLDSKYDQYLTQYAETMYALFSMAQILQNEASKSKIAYPKLSDKRVDFVVRSILIQNGIDKKKFKTKEVPVLDDPIKVTYKTDNEGKLLTQLVFDEDLSKRSNQEMYPWLVETVGEKNVNFNFDWSFEAGEMYFERKKLYLEPGETLWPAVRMEFAKLPATLEDFRNQISEKLKASLPGIIRQAAWSKILLERNRFLDWRVQLSAGVQEQKALYDKIKEKAFKVKDLDVAIYRLKVSGKDLAKFKEALYKSFADRQNALLGEGRRLSSAELTEIRSKETLPIVQATLESFRQSIELGQLTVKLEEANYSLKGGEAPNLSLDSDIASEQKTVLSPIFSALSLFPHSDFTEKLDPSVTRILVLKDNQYSQEKILPMEHPKVSEFLIQKLKSDYMNRQVLNTIEWLFDDSQRGLGQKSQSSLKFDLSASHLTSLLGVQGLIESTALPFQKGFFPLVAQ